MHIYINSTIGSIFNTPLDRCCNCGIKGSIDSGELELIETPMVKDRFYLIASTKLEYLETFPYCGKCKKSAKRVYRGILDKILYSIIFWFGLMMYSAIKNPNLFIDKSALYFVVSFLITFFVTYVIFMLFENSSGSSSYYQPVSMQSIKTEGDSIRNIALKFTNQEYARVFATANQEAINSRILKVIKPA